MVLPNLTPKANITNTISTKYNHTVYEQLIFVALQVTNLKVALILEFDNLILLQ